MITIQGDIHEGGGSIVRIACALSTLTKKPVRITNIRENREKKGLMEQHYQGIKSLAKLCNAETKGVEIGSREIEFIPHDITKKQLKVEIRTDRGKKRKKKKKKKKFWRELFYFVCV